MVISDIHGDLTLKLGTKKFISLSKFYIIDQKRQSNFDSCLCLYLFIFCTDNLLRRGMASDLDSVHAHHVNDRFQEIMRRKKGNTKK